MRLWWRKPEPEPVAPIAAEQCWCEKAFPGHKCVCVPMDEIAEELR